MIIILGVSGSGKTLQSNLLAQRRGFVALSMGQLLREHADPATLELMKQGIFLDQHTAGAILKKALAQYDLKNVVLDGYPRTIEEVEWLVEHYKKGDMYIEEVIVLEADPDTVTTRMRNRGRADDSESSIKKRLDSHFATIDGIKTRLEKAGIKLVKVDATDDIETVYNNIDEAMNTR